MKYVIAIVLSFLALTANAQHRFGNHYHYYHHHHHGHSSHDWVAPMIIGGVITYVLTRPQQPPPAIQQPQVLPPAPQGYRYEQILDANCNCYRWVLTQG